VAATPARDFQPRTLLEELLRRQDYTYEEVAARFEALAREIGESATLTSRHLRRLASGERSGTTPVTRRVLQAMFGFTAHELLTPWQSVPGNRLDIITPPKTLDVNREMLKMAALRARKFSLESARSNLTGETMDQLQDDVATLAHAYPQLPLTDVLGRLVETQDIVFTLLEGKQPPAYTRRLLILSAVLSGLLAKASHDLSDPHAALTQSRTAFQCADNADHNGLRAWVRGLQSLITYWAGRYHESVGYAQKGQHHDSRSTSSVWLAVSEARAWAALSNREKTIAALRRAEDAWDRVQPDEMDELGGICTFTRSRQLYYAADALAWLPEETKAAEDYAVQAVTAYADVSHPDWSFGDEAGSRTDLALTRILRGEINGASEAMQPVLALPTERRINGILASVRKVHAAVTAAPRSSGGTVLQEQIEGFMHTPAVAGVAR
jgi:hypothetical protein